MLIWQKLIWDPIINKVQENNTGKEGEQLCPNYQYVRFVPYPAWSYPHVYSWHGAAVPAYYPHPHHGVYRGPGGPNSEE